MHILLVGLNHKTAPLEVRESVSFSKEQLSEALPLLRRQVGEGLILSTCNRTELYTTTANPADGAQKLWRFVSELQGSNTVDISDHLYQYVDADAAQHLFRVASGLDSMILGESQILGQVRDALAAASEAQSVDGSLLGLFHAAVRVGRRVRLETSLGHGALSVSYVGVQLAQRVAGTLDNRKVMLIGAGETGKLVAKALTTAGVGDLVIANRTMSRGLELAGDLGGRAVALAEVPSMLADVDIVLVSTDSPGFIITEEMVSHSARLRRNGPLFLFDLAIPRDVEPSVGTVEGVQLYNVDDLSAIAEDNLDERRKAAAKAEVIIQEQVGRFMAWWDALDAAPIVKALQKQAEDIRGKELAHSLRMLPGLGPEQKEIVDALTRSIVRKLLHDPTTFLKNRATKSQLSAARDIFRLWEDS